MPVVIFFACLDLERKSSLINDSGIKNNSSLNYPIDFFTHNFIRLGLTGAKALQTVSQFPRETRRRYAVPKSNVFTLEIRNRITGDRKNRSMDPLGFR